ncbi:UPF0454 protein C12orf49 homolog [Centruroides sculpturatus]|uniref:UPF0454 protein C12orf49 homolog n=1 Tax=Centruroides sculpturatus TaxID=218467 RepID=UPI000C6C9CBB|nr:UPF0454 protein C12orf49 homolog [Centruroides sculpturatus]
MLKRLSRLFKRKLFLLILFLLLCCYCIVSFMRQTDNSSSDITDIRLPVPSFNWHPPYDFINNGTGKGSTCRNSIQGKILIADDKGYVCERHHVLSNGCCNPKASTAEKYLCKTCQSNGCCSVYEHCISCCLQPEKKALLQKILEKASEAFNVLFASITDHFELCLTKCRTSSQIE